MHNIYKSEAFETQAGARPLLQSGHGRHRFHRPKRRLIYFILPLCVLAIGAAIAAMLKL